MFAHLSVTNVTFSLWIATGVWTSIDFLSSQRTTVRAWMGTDKIKAKLRERLGREPTFAEIQDYEAKKAEKKAAAQASPAPAPAPEENFG